MTGFTTRPEISGTFGVVTSTHWIASAVGMRMLEAGGNAFDAAAATGFALQVVEPNLNGPLGDMTLLIRSSGADTPTVICGQGCAPAAATIDHYRSEGLSMVPGSGLLAAVIPGAFDAWMLMLRDHGSLPLRDILEPAIHYARHGHPLLARVSATIAGLAEFFRDEWPTSHATWLPGGAVPAAGSLMRNPALADTWTRLLETAEAAPDRADQIEAARDSFYRGFVAETIDDYLRTACVADSTGERRRGVLSAQDMAGWSARYESPVSGNHAGWTVWKAGFWSQGPVLLQCLNLLAESGLAGCEPGSAAHIHRITEVLKLALADREAYYGDPDHAQVPAAHLLSKAYADERRRLIGDTASHRQQPGRIPGMQHLAQAAIARAAAGRPDPDAPGSGEPTMAHLRDRRGDTVHLDVIDRWGNMVSATPSGGWLQSSPVIPGLGMALNTRAQMFWLEPGLATSLAPGRRPRTTLSPSMARAPDGRFMAFGTPGGDQQDQWQLIYLLRLIHQDATQQAAIEAPLFHTTHCQGSFYPRIANPGHLMVEQPVSEAVADELRARGHHLTISEPWSVGRLTSACLGADGILTAAATPRLMQAYAVGR